MVSALSNQQNCTCACKTLNKHNEDGAGCVRQWFHTTEPLRERRYENIGIHTHRRHKNEQTNRQAIRLSLWWQQMPNPPPPTHTHIWATSIQFYLILLSITYPDFQEISVDLKILASPQSRALLSLTGV